MLAGHYVNTVRKLQGNPASLDGHELNMLMKANGDLFPSTPQREVSGSGVVHEIMVMPALDAWQILEILTKNNRLEKGE